MLLDRDDCDLTFAEETGINLIAIGKKNKIGEYIPVFANFTPCFKVEKNDV